MARYILIIATVLYAQLGAAQDARIVRLDELRQMISSTEQPIHIVNFWATWCAPCIKELPYFEGITAAGRPDVKVTLVSLDLDLDPNAAKVFKFIERKGLRSEVVLLNEQDPNTYIDKIDNQWSGALPATLIINAKTGKRVFIERSLHQGELEQLVDDFEQKQR